MNGSSQGIYKFHAFTKFLCEESTPAFYAVTLPIIEENTSHNGSRFSITSLSKGALWPYILSPPNAPTTANIILH